MRKKYNVLKSLRGTAFVCLFLMLSDGVWGQQNVFHRDNANTGDWGSGNLPWFRQTNSPNPGDGFNQGDPDNGNTTRNDVFIGHNNDLTMSLNGRYYLHRDFTFEVGASSARTLNNTTDGGFSFSRSLINASSAAHIFNAPIGIDGNNAEIRLDNSSGGSMTFNGDIFTNNNQVFIRHNNNNSGNITFNGAMTQGGSFVKQGLGTLIFTGNANFSGSVFIDEGRVRVNTDFSSNVIDIGGGVQITTGFNATLEISSAVTISKNISVRNFGTESGNRSITFSHTTGSALISGTLALEKLATIEVTNSSLSASITGLISGNGSITKTGLGILTLTDANTYTGLTTINAGTLQLNRTGGTTIPNTNSVTVSGGTLRVSQNQTLSNLTLSSGGLTIDSGATLTLTGNVTIDADFSITNSGTLVIEGTLTDNRETKSFGGTVRYAASSGTQTVVGGTYSTIEFNGNATKNLAANATVSGNLTVNAGTLNLGEFTMNRATSGGTLTLGPNTTLTIGGTNSFPTNYNIHSIATSSTVNYNGENQVVALLNSSQSYGNLILSGTGNKTFGDDVNAENLTNDDNAVTRLVSEQNLSVRSVLTNNAEFTIENNANLIQEGTTNNNVGAITVQRNSSSLMRLDYTLWSSPVASQELLAFSPQTVASRFYIYNPDTNFYNAVTPSTTDFATGTGYLIRMPNNHPTSPTIWQGQFSGVPHNGDVSLTVTSGTYNAIGNPYPSTINPSAFMIANELEEPIYFWRKTNGATGSAYVTYTDAGLTGELAPLPSGINEEEDMAIQVGQGFIVKSTSSTLVFNNVMRAIDISGNYFFRNSQIEHNRVRLGISGPSGFNQSILVNYMTGATNDFDARIDGKYINDSETAFYTLLNDEAYVIQGRALPFDSNDVVPLGFKTTEAGSFTINLISAGGLFTENQPIYLEDFNTGLTHDFANGAYNFNSSVGVFHNRFSLRYTNQPLSIDQTKTNSLITWISDQTLYLQDLTDELLEVTLFDITGRRVKSFLNINSNQFKISLQDITNQVLMVQIKSTSGLIETKKVIH
jgi:trimeric autotransporter adhesin